MDTPTEFPAYDVTAAKKEHIPFMLAGILNALHPHLPILHQVKLKMKKEKRENAQELFPLLGMALPSYAPLAT